MGRTARRWNGGDARPRRATNKEGSKGRTDAEFEHGRLAALNVKVLAAGVARSCAMVMPSSSHVEV